MAWTDPADLDPGDVFGSAFYTTNIKDNLNSLRHLVYIKDSQKDINTSTGADDLLAGEVIIPANAMGASGAIFVTLIGDYLANSGTPTLTLEVKLGATTLWKDTSGTFTADADRRPLDIELTIGACGATNSQRMVGVIRIGTAGTPTTGIGTFAGSPISTPIGSNGKTAVDMTAAQTLVIEATHSVSNSAVSVRTDYATIWVNP